MDYGTLEQVECLRDLVAERNLSAPARFWDTPPETLHRVYNGIGPDRWSARFRASVTALLERYEEEALIHDWEYTFQPKTRLHFLLANLRFAGNAIVAAYDRSGAFSRRFWLDGGLGIVLAILCQLFGWIGYKTTNSKDFEKCVN